MLSIGRAYCALYLATVLIQFAATLLISHLALRLNAGGASTFWVGALMAANALGMAAGGSIGRTLIERLGQVRAYAAGTGIIVTAVLAHEVSSALPFWLVLRGVAGIALMAQLMALESWLNERAGNKERGRVLAVYMIATYGGMMLGQLGLTAGDGLDRRALAGVAMAFALCLVPVVMTRIPQPIVLARARVGYGLLLRSVPQALMTVLVSGMINGAFFGLAAIYARQQGMGPDETGRFLAMPVAAALLVQAPLGMLSDRLPRAMLIRAIAALLALVCSALAMSSGLSSSALMAFAFCVGALQFCLYPLGAALANELVDPAQRVALAGVLLTTFGIGSCIGPLAAGAAMGHAGPAALYWFFAACAALLVAAIGSARAGGAAAPVKTPLPDC